VIGEDVMASVRKGGCAGVVKTASDMKLIEEQDFMCARHVSVEE